MLISPIYHPMHTGKDKRNELRRHGVIIPVGACLVAASRFAKLTCEADEMQSIKLVQKAMPALVEYVKERLALAPIEDNVSDDDD